MKSTDFRQLVKAVLARVTELEHDAYIPIKTDADGNWIGGGRYNRGESEMYDQAVAELVTAEDWREPVRVFAQGCSYYSAEAWLNEAAVG